MCTDVIISTDAFGWWGAYFSQRNQQRQEEEEGEEEEEEGGGESSSNAAAVTLGRVIVPFVGKRTVLNPDDYFPRTWTQLKRDTKLS
jgi:hypothetical protein